VARNSLRGGSETLARDFPVAVTSAVCDLGSDASRQAMLEALLAGDGGLDILVNITGGPPAGPISALDAASLSPHFEAMMLSVIDTTNRLLPRLRERGWGHIITSTSSGVVQPIPDLGISNALRASLVSWSKTLASEVAGDGVPANVVVPGRIKTRRVDELDQKSAERQGRPVEDIVRESLASIPAGRYGTPEEFANVIAFLASDCASYVTGSVFRIDGGLIRCP